VRVYCDFDGTITTRDTTDYILERLARPAWQDTEAAWVAGRITAAECMRRQIALIEASDVRLDEVLDEVDIAPGFSAFVGWCATRRVPLVIVSDGVDYFIRRVLERHRLGGLPVIANRLSGCEASRRLEQPWQRADCAAGAGVCKCAVLRGGAPQTAAYIGDGRSDFCVALRANVLFAKGVLARHAHERGISYFRYTDFHDVLRLITPMIDMGREQRARAIPI